LGSWARFCSGFLLITRGEIRYEVLRPAENRDHGFQFARRALREAGQWRGLGPAATAEFKFEGGKVYHFYLVPAATLDKDPHTILTAKDVLAWPPVAQITMRFDEVLAEVQKRKHAPVGTPVSHQPAASEKPEEALGPRVRVMEPAVMDPSVPVEVTKPLLTLRGAAMDPKGVLSVSVDDHQAEMRSIGDITAIEFSVSDLKLHEGLNRVTVTAANVEHQRTRLPVLLWLRTKSVPPAEPPIVTTPTGTSTLSPIQRPLKKEEILELLRGDVPTGRIATLVEDRGIDFEPTDEDFQALRKLGAQDDLVEAIGKAKRGKSLPAK
jgi:hypothetical protein